MPGLLAGAVILVGNVAQAGVYQVRASLAYPAAAPTPASPPPPLDFERELVPPTILSNRSGAAAGAPCPQHDTWRHTVEISRSQLLHRSATSRAADDADPPSTLAFVEPAFFARLPLDSDEEAVLRFDLVRDGLTIGTAFQPLRRFLSAWSCLVVGGELAPSHWHVAGVRPKFVRQRGCFASASLRLLRSWPFDWGSELPAPIGRRCCAAAPRLRLVVHAAPPLHWCKLRVWHARSPPGGFQPGDLRPFCHTAYQRSAVVGSPPRWDMPLDDAAVELLSCEQSLLFVQLLLHGQVHGVTFVPVALLAGAADVSKQFRLVDGSPSGVSLQLEALAADHNDADDSAADCADDGGVVDEWVRCVAMNPAVLFVDVRLTPGEIVVLRDDAAPLRLRGEQRARFVSAAERHGWTLAAPTLPGACRPVGAQMSMRRLDSFAVVQTREQVAAIVAQLPWCFGLFLSPDAGVGLQVFTADGYACAVAAHLVADVCTALAAAGVHAGDASVQRWLDSNADLLCLCRRTAAPLVSSAADLYAAVVHGADGPCSYALDARLSFRTPLVGRLSAVHCALLLGKHRLFAAMLQQQQQVPHSDPAAPSCLMVALESALPGSAAVLAAVEQLLPHENCLDWRTVSLAYYFAVDDDDDDDDDGGQLAGSTNNAWTALHLAAFRKDYAAFTALLAACSCAGPVPRLLHAALPDCSFVRAAIERGLCRPVMSVGALQMCFDQRSPACLDQLAQQLPGAERLGTGGALTRCVDTFAGLLRGDYSSASARVVLDKLAALLALLAPSADNAERTADKLLAMGCLGRRADVVRFALACGARPVRLPDWSTLDASAYYGDTASLGLLVADGDAAQLLPNALFAAALGGSCAAVRLLLHDGGCSPRAPASHGSPLVAALRAGRLAAAVTLWSFGAALPDDTDDTGSPFGRWLVAFGGAQTLLLACFRAVVRSHSFADVPVHVQRHVFGAALAAQIGHALRQEN